MSQNLMKNFNFRMPGEVIFGSGCSATVVDKASSLGAKHICFITGKNIGGTQAFKKLIDAASTAGMKPGHWDGVRPEPPYEILQQAVKYVRDGGYDCLAAMGGGSSMDFTKMLAVLAVHPEYEVASMSGNDKIPSRGLPAIMLPTTSGSGSEVSAVSVFSFEKEQTKKGYASKNLVASIALVDPELTLGLPAGITAASGMDALIHAVESYLSLGTNALTQDLALSAIRHVTASLETCVKDGGNLAAREGQMFASMTAGMAFSMAGTTGVHAMAYPLGGRYHIPHGEANTVLLRWVMEYNLEGCAEKFVPVADALGVLKDGMSADKAAHAALDAMIELGEKVGVKTRMRDFGIPREAAAEMAPLAMKETRLINNNPRKLDVDSVRRIYERAW